MKVDSPKRQSPLLHTFFTVALAGAMLSVLMIAPATSTAEPKPVSEYEGGQLFKAGRLNVIVVRGSFRQMGRQEGRLLRKELHDLYRVAIEETYVREVGLKLDEIRQGSRSVFASYPKRFQDILYGMAETSGLTLDQLTALDQIYLLPKLSHTAMHCSALVVWQDYTAGKPLILGRNFDYPQYFRKFNPYLTVTVYHPDEGVPTAVVGYPAAVSAMHGVNKQGLFLALNDGTISGGSQTVDNRIVPLLFPTMVLLDSTNLTQLDAALQTMRCAAAMIFTAADRNSARAYECSTNDTIERPADKEGLLVGTNHFVAPAWNMAPAEGGEWLSVTRYKNLTTLADHHRGKFTPQLMRDVLDTAIDEGGATRPDQAVQQLVVVPSELKIWVKALGNPQWTRIDLKEFF